MCGLVLALSGWGRNVASSGCKHCAVFLNFFETSYRVSDFVLSFRGSAVHFVMCEIFHIFVHDRECRGHSLFFLSFEWPERLAGGVFLQCLRKFPEALCSFLHGVLFFSAFAGGF